MRHGISLPSRYPHERHHVAPLARRLADAVAGPARAAVVVHTDTRPVARGAWNVQVFHGLGDKGYTGNPVFLQRWRFPRVRTALNMVAGRVGLPAPFLRPPARPGRRGSRYDQLNAYGPRLADHLEGVLRGAEISRYGHMALNERGPLRPSRGGPVLWVPTWDNSAFLGGVNQSGLDAFAAPLAAAEVKLQVKLHPHTVAHDQARRAREVLAAAPGVELVDAAADPYDLLAGARAVVTDTSSLGFEAYCAGLPVAIARPADAGLGGLHAELEERAAVFVPGEERGLLDWLAAPEAPSDRAWARDLLFEPAPARNDAFAADLRARAAMA